MIELVKNKWYKNLGYSLNWIAKFDYMEYNYFMFCGSGYIDMNDTKYYYSHDKELTSGINFAEEIDISEIYHLLPSTHPDKINYIRKLRIFKLLTIQ